MRKIFLGIFFSFACCSVCGCDRTQSAQDVYKEKDSHKENIVIDTETDTQQMDDVRWISLSTDYLFEDEVTVAYEFWKVDDLRVKVLDSFYTDSLENVEEYFKTSKQMQEIESLSDGLSNKSMNYFFVDIEIENISSKLITYCVANIEPYVCKKKQEYVDVFEINVCGELAYNIGEDGDNYYYYITLQPGERKRFIVGYKVYKDLLIENKDNVYIDASPEFLDVSENGNPNPSGIGFKLLHIPVREIQKGNEK